MFSVFKRENLMRLCFSSSSSESREFLFYDPTRCYSHVRACLYGRLKEHASWKLQSVASQPTLCYASSFSASYLLGYRPCAMSQLCPLHRLYCSNISLARSVKHKYDFHSSEFESDGHWILSLHGDQSILSTTILRQKATMHWLQCCEMAWHWNCFDHYQTSTETNIQHAECFYDQSSQSFQHQDHFYVVDRPKAAPAQQVSADGSHSQEVVYKKRF